MTDVKKIILELTVNEAEILRIAIASSLPTIENEMISIMLYNRLCSLVKKACDESE